MTTKRIVACTRTAKANKPIIKTFFGRGSMTPLFVAGKANESIFCISKVAAETFGAEDYESAPSSKSRSSTESKQIVNKGSKNDMCDLGSSFGAFLHSVVERVELTYPAQSFAIWPSRPCPMETLTRARA